MIDEDEYFKDLWMNAKENKDYRVIKQLWEIPTERNYNFLLGVEGLKLFNAALEKEACLKSK